MTPQELKNSILQLAVQGKLVEQRPEEGTAEELYRQIQEEKQRLIKEGKIKKEKSQPEITEEEMSFDIPDTWKWVRLASFCVDMFSGKSPKYSKENTEFRIVGQAANQQDGLDYSQLKYTNQVFWSTVDDRQFLRKNDVLLNTLGNGTLGRSGFVEELPFPLITDGHLFVLRTLNRVCSKYLYFYLQLKRREIEKAANGSTNQTFLSLTHTSKWMIPIPPLAEQKRIVAKIEELLPLIDRYEQAWSKLEAFNKRFPDDMQKSVLQMAIEGKLVEQRPEEGTGEELYNQIQAEKQSLIKSGKIKKEKTLSEISDDEIPFDIPESWKWVRIGSLFNVGTGMTPLKSEPKFYQNGTIPWVTSSLTANRYVTKSDNYISEYALDNTSLSVYKKHTLVIAMYGQGKTRGQITELLIDATINQACAALENIVYNQNFIDYIYFYFKYNYEVIRKKAEGTSQPNLNLNKIKETIVPLPPLAEQKRIVEKLNEILPLCEKLKYN